jgi:hypothetical protein
MWVFESVTCIHGIEYGPADEQYPSTCEQCIDVLQIEDGEDFLQRLGMEVV